MDVEVLQMRPLESVNNATPMRGGFQLAPWHSMHFRCRGIPDTASCVFHASLREGRKSHKLALERCKYQHRFDASKALCRDIGPFWTCDRLLAMRVD